MLSNTDIYQTIWLYNNATVSRLNKLGSCSFELFSCHVMSCQCHVISVISFHEMFIHFPSCSVIPFHVMLCHVMSCIVMIVKCNEIRYTLFAKKNLSYESQCSRSSQKILVGRHKKSKTSIKTKLPKISFETCCYAVVIGSFNFYRVLLIKSLSSTFSFRITSLRNNSRLSVSSQFVKLACKTKSILRKCLQDTFISIIHITD